MLKFDDVKLVSLRGIGMIYSRRLPALTCMASEALGIKGVIFTPAGYLRFFLKI